MPREAIKMTGWLCKKCNTVLGFVGDSEETLLKLALYLEQSK